MKRSLLSLAAAVAVVAFPSGCASNGDSRAEHDNHRQGIAVQGRADRASGDVGQPR